MNRQSTLKNKRQKRKRESDPSSAESDDSSSDLGPEELEIIEQEQKALVLEQEQKALKKRIRQLAKLASKENNQKQSTNDNQTPPNNLPMGFPSEEGSVGQQTASHPGPSSAQPISTREQGHLPPPTEPQARDQDELIYDEADLPEEPATNYGEGVDVPQAEIM
ncbi:hypothetical protein FRC00_002422 [Tulasnella sp. 408]|nr:hypothetical protein FRC00_002422 [Tulasnella sp. 408]